MANVYFQNKTYQSLLTHLEEGEIGCVSVTDNGDVWRVYVMYGAIVGATSKEDDKHLVRRLRLAQHLSEGQARAVETILKAEKPILNLLFDMLSEDVLHDILHDRYIENIAAFISHPHESQYEKLQAVFIDNLQMGHELETILALADQRASSAAGIDSQLILARAKVTNKDEISAKILDLFDTGHTVASVLNKIPLEPLASKERIHELIRLGHLVKANYRTPNDEEPEIVGQRTVFTETPPKPRQASRGFVHQPVVVQTPTSFKEKTPVAAESLASVAQSEDWEHPIVDEPTEELTQDPKVSVQLDDKPVVKPHALKAPTPVKGVEDWYSQDHDDDVMEAFGDYDEQRGSDQGSFTTEQHRLDRVEVGVAVPEEEVIAASDGSEELFSTPVAKQKVAVANEVLRVVAKSFDQVGSSGDGQIAITELVHSAPSQMKALFDGVDTDEQGNMEVHALLGNLQSRSVQEQRRALHQAMKDIIERALTYAADELPDDVLDDILETIQGYRQRLGS